MLDTDFVATVRAAQAGDEAAFGRLWRDANPLLVRYLRVVGYDDPYDGACEAWVTVVRGLAEFEGDESDWRVWVLSCARVRATDGSLRRAWGSVDVTPGVGLPVGAPQLRDVEDDLASASAEDPRTRGIADSLAALRDLPLGQGEVLLLRLGGGLSVRETARVTGVDETTVRRLSHRGLERLGVDQDLLRWSLTAPRSVAELADERVVLSTFRGQRRDRRSRAGRSRSGRPATGGTTARLAAGPVTGLAAGAAPGRAARPTTVLVVPGGAATGGVGAAGAVSGSPGTRSRVIATVNLSGTAPATASRSGAASRRGAVAAGRSRTAVLAIAAVSASVMSLGGLSAAAYVGALPTPVQQAMHDAIGAPAPGTSSATGSSARGGSSPRGTGAPRVPSSGRSAAAVSGLCRAWSADQAAGTPRDRSVAFRDLASRAGGAERVPAYCAAAAHPTSQATPDPATPGEGTTKTPNPHSTSPGKGTTKAPNPHSTSPGKGTTKTPNPHSTSPGKGTTKTSNPHSTSPGKGTTRTKGSGSGSTSAAQGPATTGAATSTRPGTSTVPSQVVGKGTGQGTGRAAREGSGAGSSGGSGARPGDGSGGTG